MGKQESGESKSYSLHDFPPLVAQARRRARMCWAAGGGILLGQVILALSEGIELLFVVGLSAMAIGLIAGASIVRPAHPKPIEEDR